MTVHKRACTTPPPRASRSFRVRWPVLIAAACAGLVLATTSPPAVAAGAHDLGDETMLYDSQDGLVPAEVGPYQAKTTIVGRGDKKLRVDFQARKLSLIHI